MIGAALAACGPTNTSQQCNPIQTLSNWSGYYQACENSSDTYFKLSNSTGYDVFYLDVPVGDAVPYLHVVPPGGSGLDDLVEQTEFPESSGTTYAVVPPNGTLIAQSNGAPIHLMIAIDASATTENVAALGLADVIKDRVDPSEAEAEAIVECADYARSITTVNSSDLNSEEFWDSFQGATACSDAYHSAAVALGVNGDDEGSDDDGALGDLEDSTKDFFEEVLPKLAELFSGDLIR